MFFVCMFVYWFIFFEDAFLTTYVALTGLLGRCFTEEAGLEVML
jgi:hypothetical protein